ncbi:hypothetical protein ACJMK2_008117 [Sinanodonta woodiana]|uniref:Solute carrier family 12 member 9 n=1 Tax=Sinanodonta woodiana TaxID=1069815 RepID=A0ABD3VKL6_SINWO
MSTTGINMDQNHFINSESLSESEETEPLIRSPMIWRLKRSLSINVGTSRSPSTSPNVSRRTLGTFAGVFCPIALSMFSTCIFQRTGFVVGQAGLLETIIQLVLAYIILFLTVFSICAISTNGAVEGGGAYYMISRALGPEFGGAIGFMYYVANIFSCGLYVSAFVEGVLNNFGVGGNYVAVGHGLPVNDYWYKYLYDTVMLGCCLLICIIGGAMFARTSAVILMTVVVCTLAVIISVFAQNKIIPVHYADGNGTANYTGLTEETFRNNFYNHYTVDYTTGNMMSFAKVFAILFSSVTGIMNGANMSGELKDPSRSIPKGTVSAVCFTFSTYLILFILIGGSCQSNVLVHNYAFLQSINLWSPFVLAGIFATTLSAALGNLIGGSRILEALANDHLFWCLLNPATITTKGGNPFVAVLMTWFLVQLVLLIGTLNAIASVTSVFFLLCYASTNLACMVLDLASAPNFRPTFKFFCWQSCLVGMVGCIIMCFLISPLYSSVSIAAMLILIILLHFRSVPSQWGSVSQALIFHQVRKYLLMLDIRKAHVKFWRPQILLMVANPRHSCELMEFINDIKKSGLYVIGHVKVGDLNEFSEDPIAEDYPKWQRLINHMKLKAFVELSLTKSVTDGLHQLIRLSGLGGMKPNTVCLGFYDNVAPSDTLVKVRKQRRRFFGNGDEENGVGFDTLQSVRTEMDPKSITGEEYVQMVKDTLKLQKNICLCRNFHQLDRNVIFQSQNKLYIDVWPVNFFRPETSCYFDNTCLFMLQLACILNMVSGWKKKTTLRVFLFVDTAKENTLGKKEQLETFLRQLRILAKIQIVSWDNIPNVKPMEQLDLSVNYSHTHMQEYKEAQLEFLTDINRLIVSNSNRSAITFLYLPLVPADDDKHATYLQQLELLSNNLPPTMFVHGLHPVTSTSL